MKKKRLSQMKKNSHKKETLTAKKELMMIAYIYLIYKKYIYIQGRGHLNINNII